MDNQLSASGIQAKATHFEVKERSDRLMNYFLAGYFLIGLALALFYDTWLIAIGVGSLLLIAYYSVKIALPDSTLYQYVLGAVLGIFMAQFIYQMHGMFEMHFFAFIGSALLITYQKWKLQIPILIVILVHHTVFSRLQDIGFNKIYFSQLVYFDFQTFIIHILLTLVIVFICGLWAYQLKKYSEIQIIQSRKIAELQRRAQLSIVQKWGEEALLERNTILESIADAFFSVDNNWVVTYWNKMAEKVLIKQKNEMLNHNLWEAFPEAIDSIAYQKYHEAITAKQAAHFEYYYTPLGKWYEISAYPTANGLSVYFKDITERKTSEILLIESEKKYSALFHLSPISNWVFDVASLKFLDVNDAAIKHYGYSREEFLSMTIKDIRPAEEIPKLEEVLNKSKTQSSFLKGIFKHRKKNGEIIHVDIQSSSMQYKGREAKVIIATDVTERLNYIKAIEEQNRKLREISWMQSHIVRAPLARIIGLISVLDTVKGEGEIRVKIMEYLLISANELDKAIQDITDKTTIVEMNL